MSYSPLVLDRGSPFVVPASRGSRWTRPLGPSPLGQAVKRLREDRHLSQEELARLVSETGEVSWRQNQVSHLETGATRFPDTRIITRLEVVLGVERGYLLGLAYGEGARQGAIEAMRPGDRDLTIANPDPMLVQTIKLLLPMDREQLERVQEFSDFLVRRTEEERTRKRARRAAETDPNPYR